MMKILTLVWLPEDRRPFNRPGVLYRVTQVVQTTQFAPGDYLTKEEAQDLCDHPGMWKVIFNSIKG